MKVLEPIWTTKPETAGRVRGRIEVILDWARVRGHRDGENPARWKGHLDNLLPARGKVRRIKHHAALPYAELPSFMTALRDREGISARALEFAILTAARTGEAINARWAEIDGDVWTIPAGSHEGRPRASGAAVPARGRAPQRLAPRERTASSCFREPAQASPSPTWRCSRPSGGWVAATSRRTASVRPFETGPPRPPATRPTSSRWR